jgi:hypothetical protein
MEKSSLKFLADENISPVLVTIINKLGDRSLEAFNRTTYMGMPDEEWLPTAAERGYICLTCDRKMLAEPVVAQAVKATKVRAIFLGENFSHSVRWDQALWLLKHWRKIRSHAESMQPGDLIRVSKAGRITEIAAKERAR